MNEDKEPGQPEAPETSLDEPESGGGAPTRRKFIGYALGASTAVVAGLMCVPLVRESLYPVFAKGAGAVWSDLGPVEQFNSLSAPDRQVVKIQTVDGWRQVISEKIVYVTKGPNGKVEVLTAVCPHLGCEVAWQPSTDHFHCPCHGGTFAADGKYISGPPPRGMDTLPIEIRDGHLMVRYEYFENLVPTKRVIS